MTEEQATILAAVLSGEPWQSGGGVWLVLKGRADGGLVVISDEAVSEYESQEAFDRQETWNSVLLI